TAAEERGDAVRGVLELAADIPEVDRGVDVDGTALARGHDRISIRVEEAALDDRRQLVPSIAGEEIELGAGLRSVLGLELDRSPGWPARGDVDDPAHRVVAVQARARTVDDLDPIDAHQRDASPVHPSAKRIVER